MPTLPRVVSTAAAGVAAVLLWGELVQWLSHRRGPTRSACPAPSADDAGTTAVVVLGFHNRGDRANVINRYRVRAGVRSLAALPTSVARNAVLVLCGGSVGGAIPEATLMARYAREAGYTGELLIETESRSTWQNIRNVAPMIEDAARIMIVSDSLHAEKARCYLHELRPDLAGRLVAAQEYRFGELVLLKPAMSFVGWQGLRTMLPSHEKDAHVNTSTTDLAGTRDPWPLIHAERTRLADALADLTPDQWRAPSACGAWSVEDVVAHLSAVASTGTVAWIRSIVQARFDADRHNARLLARRRGATPAQTLEIFRSTIPSTVAPAKAYTALLGEVIVHGQDIARPLGLTLEPAPDALAKVARFFARKDFAVNSKTLVAGLTLRSDDVPFEVGTGPLVHGPLLDLVLAMVGRPAACAALTGDGLTELRARMS